MVLQRCVESVRAVVERARALDPQQPVRIFAPTLCLMHVADDLGVRSLALTFLKLKSLCQETQSLLTINCLPSSVPPRLLHNLAVMADTHFRLESFAGASDSVPYEFKAFSGLLAVISVQSIGVLAPYRPQNQRFGLRRDRRKLHIEPLHLPPEESRAVGLSGGVGASSESTAATVSCSTLTTSNNKLTVDF